MVADIGRIEGIAQTVAKTKLMQSVGGIRAHGLYTCARKVSTMLSEALEKVNIF